MKKHITILSLIAIVALQSCERTDSFADAEYPENPVEKKVMKAVAKQSSHDDNTTVFSREAHEDNLDLDTGDDEPRKDKQHWRTVQDSIN